MNKVFWSIGCLIVFTCAARQVCNHDYLAAIKDYTCIVAMCQFYSNFVKD